MALSPRDFVVLTLCACACVCALCAYVRTGALRNGCSFEDDLSLGAEGQCRKKNIKKMPARLQISGNCLQFPLLTANYMVQVIPAAKTTLLRLDQDLLKGHIQHPFIVFTLWTTVKSHNVI